MKHPRFIYQSFERHKDTLRFRFLLEPDIVFTPEVSIPGIGQADEWLIFNLGMVEAISYWKAACPPELVVEAGSLAPEQIAWWHDLFLNGLGEFFYKNAIDFTKSNFLTIKSTGPALRREPQKESAGDLVMVGGGKDSAVTLELLKNLPGMKAALLLNPTPAAIKITNVAGYESIIVHRTIDKKLLELNAAGYFNGHTPFSAYLAFLGALVATMHGYQHVIASNESSASEGNVEYLGKTINHQYSKSFDFERRFRTYCPSLEYFSFLRPLSELQIAELFSHAPQYHSVFTSCNVNRGVGWCGSCAKCAFVCLVLSPFLSDGQMKKIFGSDFFDKPGLQKHFLDVTGAGDAKPFDCVGTPEDAQGALSLLAGDQLALPSWNNQHFLPQKYEEVLRLTSSKSILLLGYGRENQSVERFLTKHFSHVSIKIIKQFDSGRALPRSDVIIRSPGIQKDRFSGEYVTTATNIFFSMCPGTIIGVTGTKGKSTTSALIAHFLKEKFRDVRLVGNIGNPALDALVGATAETLFVVELSSHQLEDVRFSPHIAVVLNVFPEHLDYYKNFSQYVAAKTNIVAFQKNRDFVVYDDTNRVAQNIVEKGKGKKVPASSAGKSGDVNVRAAMAAAGLFDIPKKLLRAAIKTFRSLPHRLEFVGEFRGIRFYNDSLATIPEATVRAMKVLGDDVATLIAGGFDRGLDYSGLGQFLSKRKSLKTLILFPDTGEKIKKTTRGPGCFFVSTMKEAVALAYKHTPPGKICLLSPASASFNLFADYAERGEMFKKEVKKSS